MIKELTEEQKDKIPAYVKKWIDVGVSTERLNYDNTYDIVKGFREVIALDADVPLVIAENPIEAWVMCCLYKQDVKIDDLQKEMESVFSGNPKKYEIPIASIPHQTGSFDASVFSFYDYFLSEFGNYDEKEIERNFGITSDILNKYKKWQKTCEIGCIYPLDGVTIVCQKPLHIHLNENNVLHKDGAPALAYSGLGDFKIYTLNGVDVPEWLAMTPAQELDIAQYNDIENADVKAEFVRKVGIERFIEKGKVIDTYENYDQEENPWWWKSEYELIDMNFIFESFSYAPYLKMTNQTTGVYHVEGVSPNCQTLEDAIKERFGGRNMKIINVA